MKKEASLTVEAAFVIPLGLFASMTFLYMFLYMHTQLAVYQSLFAVADSLYSAGTAGAYVEQSTFATDIIEAARNSDVSDEAEQFSSEVVSFLTGSSSHYYVGILVKNRLKKDGRVLECIVGGNDGIDCSGSSVFGGGRRIDLCAEYTFRFPYSLFGLTDRNVRLQVSSAGFYGTAWDKTSEFDDSKERKEDNAKMPEEYVYRTANGKVFHKDVNCSYIDIKAEQVSYELVDKKRNADGGKYYPCEYCVVESPEALVYITMYGTRFHNDRSCPKIERNASRLTLTEAENIGLRPCKKCSG